MGPIKLLNLLAISSLAVISSSFLAAPVNALSTHHDLLARQPIRAHGTIAKRKRAKGKSCKNRSSSAKAAASTSKSDSSKSDNKNNDSNKGDKQDKDAGGNKGGDKGSDHDGGSDSGPSGGGYSPNGKKIGLAWPNGDDTDLQFYKTGGPLYTWSPYVTPLAKKYGFEPIPMFWGPKDADDFKRLVVKGYAKAVLGFNEPNQNGQSDISPQYGAELWKKYIDPLKHQGYKLISPATTSAPSGKTWMKDFFAACDGCHFDAVALHYYDVSAQGMIDYIKDFHNTFNKPIWVTEFACQNFNGGAQKSKGEIFDFMEKTTNFMDSADYVEAYFWFGAMHDMQNVNPDNQLMGADGHPTALGNKYLGRG